MGLVVALRVTTPRSPPFDSGRIQKRSVLRIVVWLGWLGRLAYPVSKTKPMGLLDALWYHSGWPVTKSAQEKWAPRSASRHHSRAVLIRRSTILSGNRSARFPPPRLWTGAPGARHREEAGSGLSSMPGAEDPHGRGTAAPPRSDCTAWRIAAASLARPDDLHRAPRACHPGRACPVSQDDDVAARRDPRTHWWPSAASRPDPPRLHAGVQRQPDTVDLLRRVLEQDAFCRRCRAYPEIKHGGLTIAFSRPRPAASCTTSAPTRRTDSARPKSEAVRASRSSSRRRTAALGGLLSHRAAPASSARPTSRGGPG
jgi:hypothetical protein